jgi:hypothetical protein
MSASRITLWWRRKRMRVSTAKGSVARRFGILNNLALFDVFI